MFFGMLAIWIALFATLASTGAYLRWMIAERQAESGKESERAEAAAVESKAAPIGRWGFALSLAMLVLAIIQVETAAYQHDFRLSYIARFSNRAEPASYLFTTLWAGQEGTFLLWCSYITLLGVVVRKYAGSFEASVMFFLNVIRLSLLVVLIGKSPFAPVPQMLPEALQSVSTFQQSLWAFFNPNGLNMAQLPADGIGLNPLLMNPWMRIHPPTLFLGFACTAVPFAFAMAALWKKDFSSWVRRSLPWTALAFTVLGTGIMMGGYWAYAILGWGGFWGWDPVENSSKVPWLMCVLLLHAMLMQQRKDVWHKFTVLCALMPFLTVMYSSFLTRSGILMDFSVHSFGKEDDLFPFLIGPLVFFWTLGIGSWVARWKSYPEPKNPAIAESKPMSVGAFLHWAAGVIGIFAFLVWAGMSSPLITGILAGVREQFPSLTFLPAKTSNVEISYYNYIAVPMVILAAGMMTMLPLLSWRDTDLKKTWHKAMTPLTLTIFVMAIAVYFGVGRDRDGYELLRWGTGDNAQRLMMPAMIPYLALMFAGAMAFFSSLQVIFQAPGKIGRLGGYLSHAGVGVLLIGVVAGELTDREEKVFLVKGEPQQVMGYTVLYKGLTQPKNPDEKSALDLTFTRGSETFKAPTPMYFSDFNQQYMYSPYIEKYAGHDLYIAPEQPPMTTHDLAKREVEMTPGQFTETINGVSIRFVDFEASRDGQDKFFVGTVVEVIRNGQVERVQPRWVGDMISQTRESVSATTKDGKVTVEINGLNPQTRSATLVLGGEALGAPAGPPQEIARISVSTKPMINLVWLATLMVMCGGLLSVRKSFGDLARAEARETGSGGDSAEEEVPSPKRRGAVKEKEALAGAHLADGTANS